VLGPAYEVGTGTVFFRQGDPLNAVLLIEAGLVKTLQSFDTRDLIVSLRTPGWLLGAVSALSGRTTHLPGAESLSRCTLRPIAINPFVKLAETEIAVSRWLLQLMAREAAEHLGLAALRGDSTGDRLKSLLVKLARTDSRTGADGSIRIVPGMTKSDIASVIGVVPSTLSRVLRSFEEQGLIQRVGGGLVLPVDSELHRLISSDLT
jgi:CRP-like cAMP-binding protein